MAQIEDSPEDLGVISNRIEFQTLGMMILGTFSPNGMVFFVLKI